MSKQQPMEEFSTGGKLDFQASDPDEEDRPFSLSARSYRQDEEAGRITVRFEREKLEVDFLEADESTTMSVFETDDGALLGVANTPHGAVEIPLPDVGTDAEIAETRSLVKASFEPSRSPTLSALDSLVGQWDSSRPTTPIAAEKTKEQCKEEYQEDMEDIASSAVKDAAISAGFCLGGVLGCAIGLVYLGGSYVETDNAEEDAKEKYEDCLEDASDA